VISAIADPPTEPAITTVTHASLIVLDRDHRMYQWREFATVPIGATRSR
jgi:hypothetical protein